MAIIHLPASLAARAGGTSEIRTGAQSVEAALRHLEAQFPSLCGWVLDEQGRIRQHVNVFRNDRLSALSEPVQDEDEIFVIQAISGGAPAPLRLLAGTRKGLFVLEGPRQGPLLTVQRHFEGQTVEYACRDPRSGYYFASATHGQFGPHLYRSQDPAGPWTQMGGPAFDPADKASVVRIWVVQPGELEGELWAGVDPAALFRSTDNGETWSLNRPLWEHPTRSQWGPGAGGLCLHSICPWPGDPKRLAIAISAAGVWRTGDGGASWQSGVKGLVPRYMPEEARGDTLAHCIHKLERASGQPETLYLQYHGGVYRSDDEGSSWQSIAEGLPADFGFPIALDPENPNRAFVIPLVADMDRVTPDGKLRVYETTDRGATWSAHEDGLPQKDAYLTILRQAFCHDGATPLGLYFGAESGALFGSADSGKSWSRLAEDLPPIVSVRPG